MTTRPLMSPSHTSGAIQSRIQRVQDGLSSPAVIAGRPAVRWSIPERLHRYCVPGVSVAVINHGEVEWAKGYGLLEAGASAPVTPETRFQACSISKPVAAVVALHLAERGVLDRDPEVNRRPAPYLCTNHDLQANSNITPPMRSVSKKQQRRWPW